MLTCCQEHVCGPCLGVPTGLPSLTLSSGNVDLYGCSPPRVMCGRVSHVMAMHTIELSLGASLFDFTHGLVATATTTATLCACARASARAIACATTKL